MQTHNLSKCLVSDWVLRHKWHLLAQCALHALPRTWRALRKMGQKDGKSQGTERNAVHCYFLETTRSCAHTHAAVLI